MNVRITCPNPDCGNIAEVDELSLGKRGRCKKCRQVFALARPDGEPASMISGDASAWKKGATPASPTNLPEQFGRYRIMKTLGQGGMGAVYLAHDTKLDRQVALKVPYFTPQDGPQAVQRFEREARAAATLDHPNLCPIFDVGEVDGIHYLTMPYIQGKTLADAISKDQTFTEAQAAAVVRKLALALREAHDKGIIHRDLKPGNIMVNRHRELIIMDFGLARVVDGDDKPITRTGHVLGTALYMAPEQAAGEAAIGPAADVYSLGVILHELLTGRRPFEGPWSLVIGLKNVKDPEPPSKLRPDLSPALEAICLKAIARASKDRYPTMAEFAGVLEGYLAEGRGTRPSEAPVGEARSTEPPESLAVQVFAGLITQEVTSLRGGKSAAPPKLAPSKATPPRPPGRARIIAAASAAASLLLGVVIYVATDYGRIKIELDEPKAVVKFDIDGKQYDIEGLGEPISIRPGKHDYSVKWGDGVFRTDTFVIRRGETIPLRVTYEPKPKPKPKVEAKPPAEKVQAKPPSDGFAPLFNGKDLQGWSLVKGESGDWPIKDGVLTNLPKLTRLLSDRTFSDFILKFEFQIENNSAFSIDLWSSAAEAQAWVFLETTREAMGAVTTQKRGEEGRFTVSRFQPRAEWKSGGDWNSMTIEMRRNVVGVTLNGRELPEYDLTWAVDSPEFDLAERAGRIGLRRHWGDGKVSLRNILVKEIRPDEVAVPDKGPETPAPAPAEKPAIASIPEKVQGTEGDARNTITNTLGMKLALIPAGEFDMGADDSERDAEQHEKVDGKKHRVRITRPFYLGTTEVTMGQFSRFVERTGYKTSGELSARGGRGWNVAKGDFEVDPKYNWRSNGFPQEANHPVSNVSWNDAAAFCNWLSLEEGHTYRLPTEAEWEYSCRAGGTGRYSFGDDPESLARFANVADGTARDKYPSWRHAIEAKDGYVFDAPVGRYLPNAFGLYDMHGNVWEWCADWYDPNYYSIAPTADPFNASPAALRVRRGGCWDNDHRFFRSALRNASDPNEGGTALGFRVVLVADFRPASPSTGPRSKKGSTSKKKVAVAKDVPVTLANNDGFMPLFNGKDLSGWVAPANKDLFTVEDGAILGKGGSNLERNEYLVTDRPYGDFILKARVKLTSGNSGLQFRSKRTPDGVVSGPQADIGKDCWGLLYEEHGRGVLVGSPDGKAAGLVREGDWNDFLIEASGDRVRVSLNGLLFADRTDPIFDKRGIIGLQVHTGPPTEVRFKDIEIKELSTEVEGGPIASKGAPPVARSRIPADAVAFGGRRYKVFTQDLTWHEAKAACEQMGGRLAIITDAATNRFVVSQLSASGLDGAWLGATDEVSEGRWVWVDGSPLGFNDWDTLGKQPNNKGGLEHYLVLYQNVNGWRWADQPVRSFELKNLGFVCEWVPKAVAEKSAAGKQPATRGIAAEAFRPGSVWVHDGGTFEILTQDADRFTARSTSRTGFTVREIHGFVEADRFRWLASDVVAIKGNQGSDNWGVVRGDEILVNYSVNGGPTTSWSARLDRGKAP
jgi:formylglycine-generating enzyme required for sulfatase activity/serine/threonine protein kinase